MLSREIDRLQLTLPRSPHRPLRRRIRICNQPPTDPVCDGIGCIGPTQFRLDNQHH